MDQLLQVFGFDGRVLIAQIIVFAFLYWALNRFGLKPILTFVQERTKKIEEGLQSADRAEQALKEAQAARETMLAEARQEAQHIIAEARENAKQLSESDREKAQEEIRAEAERAKKQIEAMRDKALRETQEQAVELVLAATEKVLREKLDSAADKAYIEKMVAEVQ